MAQCSNCGFDLEDLPPPQCPRCRAPTLAAAVPLTEPPPFDPPGAPPDFQSGQPPSGATLFGVPQATDDDVGPPSIGLDGALELPSPDGPAPPAIPPPPPGAAPPAIPPPPPGAGRAPPALEEQPTAGALADLPSPVRKAPEPKRPQPPRRYGELDLAEDDGALELDLPVAPKPTPLPGELNLPTSGSPSGAGALDLPAPVARRPTPPPKQPPGYSPTPLPGELNLPTPVAPRRGPGPKAPPPPPPHGQAFTSPGLDLPAPVRERDLPTPVRTPGGVPQAPELDLPVPADLDLPVPTGLDLPAPTDFNLPQPIGLDLEPASNLPEPAGLDVEPQGGNQVAPANLGVEPANLGVEPANLGVEPANLGLEPAAMGLAPAGAAEGGAVEGVAGQRAVPMVRGVERPGISRGVLYGGAAAILLAALGAGLFYAGVFDPEIDNPSPRGVAKKAPDAPDSAGDGGSGTPKAVEIPAGPAKERTDAVLAKFRADTPLSYQDAAEATKAGGDRVGYAESVLLLSQRYGPDADVVAQAETLLKPYANSSDAFVLRVFGLLALAKGAHADALRFLKGESAREHLYRGWLQLGQGKPAEAITEAKAVLKSDPSAVAALHLQHAAGLMKSASVELPMLNQTATQHPDHPGLQELRLRAGIQVGNLATAKDALAKIQLPEGAPAVFRARRAALEGLLAAAHGDLIKAVDKYDEALALAPKNVDARVGKIRALLSSGDVQTALTEATTLSDERPGDPEIALLRVEVEIEAGDADDALKMVEALAKTLPDRAEVPYFRGQVHALRAQLDEAKAEFAKALEKDPAFHKASLAEAEMLAGARMQVEAISTLDGALRRANEAAAPGPVQAELLNAKAKLLVRQNQATAALAALDKVMAVDEANNEAQVLRGQLRLEAGQMAEGKADLLAVFERTGGYPGLAGPLGRILVREGKIDDAAKLVGDTADDERAPVDVKLVAARVKLAQGDSDAAKTHLGHVLAQASTNWEAHTLMAQAFLDGGDPAEALRRIDNARPSRPQAEVHLLKGKILEYNNRHADARPEYLKALKIDPNRHEARFLYGRLLAYTGAAKQAELELSRVVDATGDRFPEAWLNLGRAQRELGQNDKALTSLAKATSLDENQLEGYYLHGRIVADRNQHAKAIALFKKAVSKPPEGAVWVPDAWASLGRALSKSGQKPAAKNAFKKFLEVAPETHPSRGEAERQLKAL